MQYKTFKNKFLGLEDTICVSLVFLNQNQDLEERHNYTKQFPSKDTFTQRNRCCERKHTWIKHLFLLLR